MFSTVSLAQPHTKVVPDSLICLEPVQVNVLISQSFDLKQCRTSLVLRDSTISDLQFENRELRFALNEKEAQLDLAGVKNKICLDDNKYITGLLHNANRKARLGKTGFVIVVGVALAEGGIIIYQKLKR